VDPFDCCCTIFAPEGCERAGVENARGHKRRKVGTCFTLVEAQVVAQYIKKLLLHEVHLWEIEVFGVCCPIFVLGR